MNEKNELSKYNLGRMSLKYTTIRIGVATHLLLKNYAKKKKIPIGDATDKLIIVGIYHEEGLGK